MHELSRELGELIALSFGVPNLNSDVLALDPAEIAHGFEEGVIPVTSSAVIQVAHKRHLSRLLRLCCGAKRKEHGAKRQAEITLADN